MTSPPGQAHVPPVTAPSAGTGPVTRRFLGIALAVVAGLAIAAQSRINGELAVRLDDALAAAVVSFGSGLLLLAALVPVRPAGRRSLRRIGTALRAGGLRRWHLLGGLSGAFLVAVQSYTVGALGVAVFTVALVAGQTGSGLAVDRLGLGPGGRQQVTTGRMIGATLTVCAVLIAVGDHLGQPATLALAVLPALAGIGSAWQQAANGQIRAATGSALAATFVNFLVGTTFLLLGYLVLLLARGGLPERWPGEVWLYIGGLLGVVVIAISSAVVRFTGVLLLAMGIIAGQVVGAVLLDLFAPAASRPGTYTLVGAALTLFAVTIAARRSGRGQPGSRTA